MDDLVKIGRISSPQGIKGEVKVYPYTDEPGRFSEIESVILDGRKLAIEKVRYAKGMAVLKLEGVDDRNASKELRGKDLFVRRVDLPEQPQDVYFVQDLIGMDVVDEEGRRIGELIEVNQNSSQDIYIISKEDGGSFMLPAVKEFVRKVDIEQRRMTVRLIEGLSDL